MNTLSGPPKQLCECSILIIDDEPDWLAICQQALGEFKCHMEFAKGWKDAVARLENKKFDLAISNFNLRESFSVSNAWYAETSLVLDKIAAQDCPIIMITGVNQNDFDLMNKIRELRQEYTKIVCVLTKLEITSFKLRNTVKDILEEFVLKGGHRGSGGGGDSYNIAIVRKLLLEVFVEGTDLRRFCYDKPQFRPVIPHFGPKYSLAEMVDSVIDYCRAHELFCELLQQIEEFNPQQYQRFYHDLCT